MFFDFFCNNNFKDFIIDNGEDCFLATRINDDTLKIKNRLRALKIK